jgi:hypothetical protein
MRDQRKQDFFRINNIWVLDVCPEMRLLFFHCILATSISPADFSGSLQSACNR